MHVAIQGFPTADVTTDRRDPAIHSAVSGPLAIGHRREGHRAHVEERQDSVHDRRRGRSLPRLEPGDSETLLQPRGPLRYPDSHLQHPVVRRAYTPRVYGRTESLPLVTMKLKPYATHASLGGINRVTQKRDSQIKNSYLFR